MISVDFEAPIDSDLDMIQQGRNLFLPAGAGKPEANMFLNMYLNSPLPEQRQLGQQTWDNRDNRFYNTFKGLFPIELELEMMENGGLSLRIMCSFLNSVFFKVGQLLLPRRWHRACSPTSKRDTVECSRSEWLRPSASFSTAHSSFPKERLGQTGSTGSCRFDIKLCPNHTSAKGDRGIAGRQRG